MSVPAVVGDELPPGLAPTLQRWCGLVARFLGRDLPDGLVLEVRRRPGVPLVQGRTIYLPEDVDGSLDITHIPHEIVHVIAGASPSRFLAEGVAVHADASLRLGRPCWPCYRLIPDQWMTVVMRRDPARLDDAIVYAESLSLDSSSGPDALARAWRLYVTAGSFTGFLFRTRRQSFWEGYDAGACWRDGSELAELERRWRETLPVRLSDRERALMEASARDAQHDLAARGAPTSEPAESSLPDGEAR